VKLTNNDKLPLNWQYVHFDKAQAVSPSIRPKILQWCK